MNTGIVKWFNEKKGFGFIECNGQDYFVHFKEIKSPGFKTLNMGDSVQFIPGKSQKGNMATNVIPNLS